jgi:hypothetical protein
MKLLVEWRLLTGCNKVREYSGKKQNVQQARSVSPCGVLYVFPAVLVLSTGERMNVLSGIVSAKSNNLTVCADVYMCLFPSLATTIIC